ncbi:MAG TPA: hypothetical protein V6D10_22885 [Trichocoleus sp.]
MQSTNFSLFTLELLTFTTYDLTGYHLTPNFSLYGLAPTPKGTLDRS